MWWVEPNYFSGSVSCMPVVVGLVFNVNAKTTCMEGMVVCGGCFVDFSSQALPQDQVLHKIFNRNTVKVSYSCMLNMSRQSEPTTGKSQDPPMTNHQSPATVESPKTAH